MPDTYMLDDSERIASGRMLSRSDCGLPEEGIVFCCLNNSYKINPDIFDIWMRILQRVEGSVLWLLEDNPAAAKNLKMESEKRGVSSHRLIFAKRMSWSEHVARHHLADLFIDTLPYNAHTTTSDALRAGLPVLTQIGHAFAGRVAASLLNAVGLPELITHSPKEYEDLAVNLGLHPEKLAALREKLASHLTTAPLFDTALFTRNIESAYRQMYERYQQDLAPKHLYIRGG